MPNSSLLTRRSLALALGALTIHANTALAAGLIAKAPAESTALHLGKSGVGATSSSGGASLIRTIVGLAIVIAVIWGVSWLLRQMKSGRETKAAGTGLASLASLPLGSGRSLQLVRAGSDYVLLGVAEHGVVPIHRYSEDQARAAGLLSVAADNPMLADSTAATGAGMQIPGLSGPGGLVDRLRQWTVRA